MQINPIWTLAPFKSDGHISEVIIMAVKHSLVLKTHVERLEKRLNDRSSSYARKHLMEIRKMASSVEGLERLALSRNLKDTPEAHLAKVASATKRLKTQSTNTLNSISETYREGAKALTESIQREANLVPNKFAPEIRQAFHGMSHKDKMDVLNNSLKNKNTETLAAILEAPEILTGLNEDTKARYRDSAEKMLAPELYQQREELNEAFEVALAAEKSMYNAIKEGFDPDKLAEIDAAEQKHQEAAQAFESAMTA